MPQRREGDVDDDTFNHLCGDQSLQGSYQLANVNSFRAWTRARIGRPALAD